MTEFIDGVIAKAKSAYKTIVLPEGEDIRVLEAGARAAKEKIAKIIILGNEDEIKAKFAQNGWSMENVQIINPLSSSKLDEYAKLFYELRKDKGVSQEDAYKTAQNANYFGTLMIKAGDVDGMVSGAAHSTADTVRPALQIVKSARKDMAVSAFFFMSKGEQTFIFADSGLTPNPDERGLANIAMQSAQTAVQFGIKPDVAMLSYSTYGSAKGELVEKVQNGTKIAKELAQSAEFASLGVRVDGELQADAALVDSVAKSKAPGSEVAGHAKVLIFPDLNAGNIAYKLVQRLGGFEAYGPILQGLNGPINDLSRGCSADDIVGTIAITAVQAMK
ncbi:MAG: phosphate acetyltransferase [Alphaproteobacteria bacterium]|nr:phosphate acetyltransferase [Alphaproteobacteria bacterium]